MKEVGAHEPAIHRVHMAIDHVAGAVGVREVKGQEKGILLGAELFDGFKSCAVDRLFGPSEKGSDLLAEISGCLGMIDIPDLLLDGWKEGLEPFLAAITDPDEGVQEAFDDHDGGKERSPGILGSLPAICIDCLGCIFGLQVTSFFLKTAIRLGERCFVGVQRQGSTQHTIVAHRRRNVAFLAVEMDVLFIGLQFDAPKANAIATQLLIFFQSDRQNDSLAWLGNFRVFSIIIPLRHVDRSPDTFRSILPQFSLIHRIR